MTCMCGDTHCGSCGPAQGNSQCPICRAWMDDGCDHIDDSGEIKAEYFEEAKRIWQADLDADEAYAKELQAERQP